MSTNQGDSAGTWRDRICGLRAEMQALAGELEQLRQMALRNATENHVIAVGGVELDEGRHELRIDGQPVRVTHGEYRLLQFLLRRPGQVYPRQMLLREVCGLDNPGQARNVDAHVHRLRHKLGRAADALEVVHGVGYRWRTDSAARRADPHSEPEENTLCQ